MTRRLLSDIITVSRYSTCLSDLIRLKVCQRLNIRRRFNLREDLIFDGGLVQFVFTILLSLSLLTGFSFLTGGDDDLFRLDNESDSSGRVDLLKAPSSEINFEIKQIIGGHFFAPETQSLLLVETFSDFSRKSESSFKLSFAEISSGASNIPGSINNPGRINIRGESFQFNGMPLKFKSGDVNGDGLDEVLFQWLDRESNEIIQAIAPDGSGNSMFPARNVPDDRREDIAFADMDGDGISEVVIPSLTTELSPMNEIDKIIVYFLQQDKFRVESYAIIPAPLVDLVVADTNLDGKDEIITLRNVKSGSTSQAIWSIMRRDDGVYVERPLAEGDKMSLVPTSPQDSWLYYIKKIPSTGHYYNQITEMKFAGDDFSTTDECRLLPEGLIFGMQWGHFMNSGSLSLAVITDEALSSRRWLTIYTPSEDAGLKNKLTLIADDSFNPVSDSTVAVDLDGDLVDELLYVGGGGVVYQFDIESRNLTQIMINR